MMTTATRIHGAAVCEVCGAGELAQSATDTKDSDPVGVRGRNLCGECLDVIWEGILDIGRPNGEISGD